jgi:hypothetical protein
MPVSFRLPLDHFREVRHSVRRTGERSMFPAHPRNREVAPVHERTTRFARSEPSGRVLVNARLLGPGTAVPSLRVVDQGSRPPREATVRRDRCPSGLRCRRATGFAGSWPFGARRRRGQRFQRFWPFGARPRTPPGEFRPGARQTASGRSKPPRGIARQTSGSDGRCDDRVTGYGLKFDQWWIVRTAAPVWRADFGRRRPPGRFGVRRPWDTSWR